MKHIDEMITVSSFKDDNGNTIVQAELKLIVQNTVHRHECCKESMCVADSSAKLRIKQMILQPIKNKLRDILISKDFNAAMVNSMSFEQSIKAKTALKELYQELK